MIIENTIYWVFIARLVVMKVSRNKIPNMARGIKKIG